MKTLFEKETNDLCEEWEVWCALEGLPCMSMDELEFAEGVTEGQLFIIRDFQERWETLMNEEQEKEYQKHLGIAT